MDFLVQEHDVAAADLVVPDIGTAFVSVAAVAVGGPFEQVVGSIPAVAADAGTHVLGRSHTAADVDTAAAVVALVAAGSACEWCDVL